MKVKKRAIAIMSGGVDSTLCAYMLKNMGYEIVALHFNYSQRTQKKELEAFNAISKELKVAKSYSIDLDFFKNIASSSLIDTSMKIRTSGVKQDTPSTYVAYRNGIFLSIAAALAEKEDAKIISIGVVQEDGSGYPDCRSEFIDSINRSINLGTKDSTNIEIFAPLLNLNKSQIITKAIELNVPLELTWSCYSDEDEACGVCDSCRLRLEGFKLAKKDDPIRYKRY